MTAPATESPTPLEQFERKLIRHDHLIRALDDLLLKLSSRHINFTVVTGPSGVGKTTLLKHLHKMLLEQFKVEIDGDPGAIPFVIMETASPDLNTFSWSDFFHRLLQKLGEPQALWKVPRTELGLPLSNHRLTKTTSELRRMVEQSLHHRRTKILILDEAQHLLRVANGRRLRDQMEMIKSLASLGNVVVALVGIYDLVQVMESSAQLARRARLVHFPRYRIDIEQEAQTFCDAVAAFERAFPVRCEGLLVNDWVFLYEHSLGCIGVLKDWLLEAATRAINAKRSHLTRADLEGTKLSAGSLLQMATEIQSKEAELRAQHTLNDQVRQFLQIPSGTAPTPNESEPRTNRRPGVRNPSLDPVGVTAP